MSDTATPPKPGDVGCEWDPATLTAEDWERVTRRYAFAGEWAISLGPHPGFLGCNVPHDSQMRYGYDVRVFDPLLSVQILAPSPDFWRDRVFPLPS